MYALHSLYSPPGRLQRSGLIVKYGLTSIHTIPTFLPCASSHPSLIRASPHPPFYLGCACPFPTSLTEGFGSYFSSLLMYALHSLYSPPGRLQRSGLIVKYGLTSIHTIPTFLPCASSHPSLIRASPHPTLYLGCACPFPTSLTRGQRAAILLLR